MREIETMTLAYRRPRTNHASMKRPILNPNNQTITIIAFLTVDEDWLNVQNRLL